MNTSRDKVIDQIESAQRMLAQARAEYTRGNVDDAVTFLEVSTQRAAGAIQTLKMKPVSLSEQLMRQAGLKETSHAR